MRTPEDPPTRSELAELELEDRITRRLNSYDHRDLLRDALELADEDPRVDRLASRDLAELLERAALAGDEAYDAADAYLADLEPADA